MPEPRWFKGNIHTHTTKSDGDASPEKVTRWYRRHGYDFLVLSAHNHLTLLDYASGKRRFKRPLMIPGEEVSANILAGEVPIHVNGTGITLEEVDLSQERISIRIRREHDDVYVTRFIGRNGTIHAEVEGTEAVFSPRGDEGYVRAAVSSSWGPKAWTQPVFLTRD